MVPGSRYKGPKTSPGLITRRSKQLCVALVTSAALFSASCGVGGNSGQNDADGNLHAGDYTVVAAQDLANSVVVNGNIAPIRAMSITTTVQSEVERLAVQPGDRVQKDQFLVAMNTDALQRQLAQQERQQANAQAEAMQGVEQARSQLNALDQSLNDGSHPAIAAAQAQVTQAQAAYDAAVAAQGGPRMIGVPQRIAQRFSQLAGQLSSQIPGGSAQPAPAAPAVPVAPAAPGAPAMPQGAPGQLGGDAAALTVEQAAAALQEAQAALQAAKNQAAQERQQLQGQVDSAWRAAENASLAEGDGTLQYQVQDATVYAPMAGIVTSVDVQVGDIPQGRLLNLADDSRLLIRANVREADVPLIRQNNRVEFTSTATGKKTFAGRVNRVSPVGSSGGSGNEAAALAAGGSASGGSVMFPVEIEVTGDKEGLLLGGSVRAEIITEESENSLNVPQDAVFDGNKILVVATDEAGDATGVIEQRTVQTGAANDIDVAVVGGELKPGEIVINWPEEYKDRIGQSVAVKDPNFSAELIERAQRGEKDEQPTSSSRKQTPAATTPKEQ